jgi:hypothetical protein
MPRLARAHLNNFNSKVTQTYATSTLPTGRAPIQLVSESTKLLDSLAKLNNKATNVKLESANYLATQIKQYE